MFHVLNDLNKYWEGKVNKKKQLLLKKQKCRLVAHLHKKIPLQKLCSTFT
jgi:hypothetical protein